MRSHWRPKISSSVPIVSCSNDSESHVLIAIPRSRGEGREGDEGGDGAGDRGLPAAGDAHREDDRERLDELHEGRDEHRTDQRRGRAVHGSSCLEASGDATVDRQHDAGEEARGG